jgi:C4-dicarboxylate transporter, DctQ subunit
MTFAKRLLSTLFGVEAAAAIIAYIIIAGLLLIDVILRETIGGSIYGSQRVAVYAMIVTGFLGLGLAAHRGQHLRPRFADGLIPSAFSDLADRAGSLIMACIFGTFGVVGIEYVLEAISYGDLARIINIPLWIIQLIIPYAFFSTALRYIIYALWPHLKPSEKLET